MGSVSRDNIIESQPRASTVLLGSMMLLGRPEGYFLGTEFDVGPRIIPICCSRQLHRRAGGE